jgi:hypothetical protein
MHTLVGGGGQGLVSGAHPSDIEEERCLYKSMAIAEPSSKCRVGIDWTRGWLLHWEGSAVALVAWHMPPM